MTRRQGLCTGLCLMIATMVLPLAAGAQCMTTWSNANSPDLEYFGLDVSGQRRWVGQEFTTDCAGQFLRAAFMVTLDLFSFNGVATLAGGDAVTCSVLDDQNQVIATAGTVLESGIGFQWVVFDFSPQELGLAAGVLSVRIETSLDAYGWVASDLSQVPGRLMIGDATNTFYSEAKDTAFEVVWDPLAIVVGTEEYSWGAVKALYR
jgi:hypothetical protein